MKKDYDKIFAADGIYSAIKKEFMRVPGFSFNCTYSKFGYCELRIPAIENAEEREARFRLDKNTFYHWPRKDIDVHMWSFPNFKGDYNVGLTLKIKGENSYEYFKDNFEAFETFMHETYPDSKWLMPNLKEVHSKW